VENFRDGTLAARGLGYEELIELNPRLVYCSITGFGSRGGAALSGYDFLVQAVGGLMSITGDPNGEPQKTGVALVDVLTSKDALIGVLAALHARSRSGRGQRIEVNLLSSLLGSLANQASAYLATGTSPHRMGNQHPSIAPYETLRCKDGLLAVCCGNDAQFGRLTAVLEVASLAEDPRFVSNTARVANRAELVAELEDALSADTTDAWAARLTDAGVPAGKIGTVGSAIDLATALGLEPVVSCGDQSSPMIRHPISYSATPVTRYLPPPRLGAHSDEIRHWLSNEADT
jgi:formyl-CoA transferase